MFGTTRAEIAAALNDVPANDDIAVIGYETRPVVLKAGDAWPQLGSVDRGPGLSWDATWQVFVALPADGKRAIAATDALFHDLTDALASVLYVEQVTPVVITTEAGDRPALQVTGRSE